MDLNDFETIIFDCDGVILNSNKIKTEGFFKTSIKFGKKNAEKLVKYHILNGGKSRYEKFNFFIDNILNENLKKNNLLNELLIDFDKYTYKSLCKCEISKSIFKLKSKNKYSKWAVVSGSDHIQLNKIFEFKKIKDLFELGIFGSPENKIEIIQNKLNKIKRPILFIGDSELDYKVANYFNYSFLFLYGWTEMFKWKRFCKLNKIKYLKTLESLIK